MPVSVDIDEIGVVSEVVCGVVCEVVTGTVGPAEVVVVLTVGIGYGFVSWGIEDTGEL